jgi:hypothetical protein
MQCLGGFCAYGSGSAPASSQSPPAAATTALFGNFDEQGRILISDPFEQAGRPRLGFAGGRFMAAYSTVPSREPQTANYAAQLNLAEISDVGVESLWTQKPARALSHQIAAMAADGRVGAFPHSGVSCAVEIFQPRLIGAYPRFIVGCENDLIALAAVPGSIEWVVAHADDSAVHVGRYDPSAETWTVPALAIGLRGIADVLAVTVDGDDALVAWNDGGPTQLRKARGLGAVSAADAASLGPLVSIAGRVHTDGAYDFATLEDRLIVLGMDGTSLWTASLAGSDEPPAVTSIASSGVVDRRPAIAAASEIGLAGVCYATGPEPWGGVPGRADGIAFALIDAEGRLAAEPRVLAADVYDVGGCDIAWSGEDFLVAWMQVDDEADPELSAVHGRRITDF